MVNHRYHYLENSFPYQSSRFQPTIPANHYRLPCKPAFNISASIGIKTQRDALTPYATMSMFATGVYIMLLTNTTRQLKVDTGRRGPPALMNLGAINTQRITYSLANDFVFFFFLQSLPCH